MQGSWRSRPLKKSELMNLVGHNACLVVPLDGNPLAHAVAVVGLGDDEVEVECNGVRYWVATRDVRWPGRWMAGFLDQRSAFWGMLDAVLNAVGTSSK